MSVVIRPSQTDGQPGATQPSGTAALSVVIPVYNEGANIIQTLRVLREHVPVAHEVLMVYDHENDQTLPVVRPLQSSDPRLILVRNTVAPGPSGALRTGFQRARGSLILVVMADLCDDFSQIPDLLALVPSRADIACPSRYCRGGQQHLRASLKVWLPKFAGRCLHWFAGLPTLDATNSFKLYSAAMLRRLRLRSTVSFSVTLEIVAKAHCLGYRLVEVPTVWRDRQHGQSHFRLGASVAAYLPWFGVALLRGRLIRLPARWLRAWLSTVPARPEPAQQVALHA